MKDYLTVLKLLVKNSLKGGKNQKKGMKIASYVIVGVAWLILMISAVFFIITAAPSIVETQMQSEVLTLLFALCCVIILFFGIRAILGTLYFTRDAEFFAALPITPSTVYFAKMSLIYLGMLAIEAVIMLPIVITLGITMRMSAVFYIAGVVAVATLPTLPLMLASVIAMPLMYLVGKFRNRNALSSVVMIVLFALVFAAYYYVVSLVSVGTDGASADFAEILLSAKPSLQTMANILLPISSIARLASETSVYGLGVGMSALVNIAIYVGFTALLIVVSFIVSSLAYKKGVSATSEGSGAGKSKKRDFRAGRTEIGTLMKKEWRQLIRTPTFAFNSLMMVVFVPLIVLIMSITTVGVAETAAEEQIMNAVFSVTCFMMTMMLGIGMNIGASTCITREGETFAFSKSLPVPFADQLRAKRRLYLIFGYATAALSAVISAIMFKSLFTPIAGLIFFIPYNYAFVTFAIIYDLSAPHLKWNTPQEAIKRNFRSMVPFLVNAGISLLAFIPIVAVSVMQATEIGLSAATLMGIRAAVWGALTVGALIFAALMDSKLKRDANRLYERIEC